MQDKTIEAMMVARETFPDKWAEEERRRLERHTTRVEEALKCVCGTGVCEGGGRAPDGSHPNATLLTADHDRLLIHHTAHTSRTAHASNTYGDEFPHTGRSA